MKKTGVSFFRKLFKNESGQSLPWVAFGMVCMVGMGGLTVDLGHFYVVRSQLQNITDAAGLAAAGSVFDVNNISDATTAVNNSLSNNPIPGLTLDSGYPLISTPCLNYLMPTTQQICVNDANGNAVPISTANALRVKLQVHMPTYFMRIFGITSLSTASLTTASLTGPANNWNVAIIIDATGSMADTDTTDTGCSGETKMQCALQAVQAMLGSTPPCANNVSGSNCSYTNTSAIVNAHMSLWTFPGMLTSALPNAFTGCSGTSTPVGAPNSSLPTTMWYAPLTLPVPPAATDTSGYTPLTYQQVALLTTDPVTKLTKTPTGNPAWTATGTASWSGSYEITYNSAGTATSQPDENGFVTDYYDPTNTTTGKLNPSSELVKAIGYTGTSTQYGCLPVTPNGIDLNSGTNQGPGSTILHDSVASGTVGKDGQWSGGGTQECTSISGNCTAITKINQMGVGHGITDVAPVIYAAQRALLAEQALNVANGRPAGQNAIVLVSDGGMQAQWEYFPQGQMQPPTTTACPTPPGIAGTTVTTTPAVNCMFTYVCPTCGAGLKLSTAATFISGSGSTNFSLGSATGLSSNLLNTTPNISSTFLGDVYEYYKPSTQTGAGSWMADISSSAQPVTNTGTYPDFVDECQQSIMAAQYAAAQGTRVYSAADQASTTGCSYYASAPGAQDYTDVTLVMPTGTYNGVTIGSVSNINPCVTMETIASSLEWFYSTSTSGCTSPDHPNITTLKGILGAIGVSFSTPALIPNNVS